MPLLPFLRSGEGASYVADELGGQPEGGKLHMWVRGIIFPLVPIVIGIWVLLSSSAGFVALFLFSLAAFGHFRWFWGLHDKLIGFSNIGKNVAAIGMICSILYFFYYFFFRM